MKEQQPPQQKRVVVRKVVRSTGPDFCLMFVASWTILIVLLIYMGQILLHEQSRKPQTGPSSWLRNQLVNHFYENKGDHFGEFQEKNDKLNVLGEEPLYSNVTGVDTYETGELSPKDFFNNYLKASRPVFIKGLAKDWPGFTRWQSDEYLKETSGDDIITVEEIDRQSNEFAYFAKKYGRVQISYSEFMDRMANESRTRNYYFAEQTVPPALASDIIEPIYGKLFMNTIAVFYWDGIGTKSLGHQDDAENFMCVIRGWKEFYLATPFESNYLYAGQKEAYPANYSPLSFDNLDTKTWPEASKAKILKVRINKGDCLFVPSHWWHQVNSSQDRTIAISHWWQSHHPVVGTMQSFFVETV